MKEIDQYKQNKGQRIEKYFWTEKEKLLQLEKKALKNCPTLDFLIVNLNCTKFDRNTDFLYKEQRELSILDFILSAGWKENKKENLLAMESSVETSS